MPTPTFGSFTDLIYPVPGTKYDRNFEGGHGFSTRVVTKATPTEQRNINWDQDRGRWALATSARREEEYTKMRDFMLAKYGMYMGFPFFSWNDHEAALLPGVGIDDTYIALGDGTQGPYQLRKTYADLIIGIAQGGSTSSIQLQAEHYEFLQHKQDGVYDDKLVRLLEGPGSAGQIKTSVIQSYTGSTVTGTVSPNFSVAPEAGTKYAIELNIYPKNIYKIFEGPLTPQDTPHPAEIYVNGALTSGTLTPWTGQWLADANVTAGAVITGKFNFCFPVRAASDQERSVYMWKGARSIASFPIIEIVPKFS